MPVADTAPAPKLAVPDVSQDDLVAFHQAHFSEAALHHFSSTYLHPSHPSHSVDQDGQEEWGDDADDLGYYDDGVKRTLTDEQIAIFRHSEMEQLRKAEERAAMKAAKSGSPDGQADRQDRHTLDVQRGKSKVKKRKSRRLPQEPKPDLRKRTWDKVEEGLDSLDYD